MSHLRRSTVRKITDSLWANDQGEKFQLVEGLLIPSAHVLNQEENEALDNWLKLLPDRPSKQA